MNTYFRVLLFFCIFLLPGLQLGAQEAEIGRVTFYQDVELTSKTYLGQKGVRLEIANIKVTGYKNRQLFFVFTAYRDSRKNAPVDHFNKEAPDRESIWKNVSFELSEKELSAYLGTGEQKVRLHFYIYVLNDGKYHILEGSRVNRELTLNINPGSQVDTVVQDRAYNEKLMLEKAKKNSSYRKLYNFAARYDLMIGFREFKSGTKATFEAYTWDFLNDSDDPMFETCIEALLKGFSRLPEDFVRETGLKGIVFVKNITYRGQQVGGGFDVGDKYIMCTVNAYYSADDILHILYHEYMHLMDNLLYSSGYFKSEEWHALNKEGTGYSQEGAIEMIRKNKEFIYTDHPLPGFLNGYCLADIYQDKAEVFSYLLTPGYYRKAEPFLKEDPYLRAKFDFMKTALARISPAFDTEYFRLLHEQK